MKACFIDPHFIRPPRRDDSAYIGSQQRREIMETLQRLLTTIRPEDVKIPPTDYQRVNKQPNYDPSSYIEYLNESL